MRRGGRSRRRFARAGRHPARPRSPDRRTPGPAGRRGRAPGRACGVAVRAGRSSARAGITRSIRIEVAPAADAEPASEALRTAADPDEPLGLGSPVADLVPPVDATYGRSPLRIWILPAIVLLAAIASTSWALDAAAGVHGDPRCAGAGAGAAAVALDRHRCVRARQPRARAAGTDWRSPPAWCSAACTAAAWRSPGRWPRP